MTGHVLDPHPPTAAGRRSRGGDVATQRDQYAAAQSLRDPGRGPVRGPSLRGRSEVETGTWRHAQAARAAIEGYLPPARHRPSAEPDRRPVRCDEREVAIVSEG